MQNKVWERVIEFLNRLRCENVSRDTVINIPEYEDAQKELEMLHNKCEKIMQHLSDDDQKIFLKWIEKAEDMVSLEGKKAYCQGYVDCIFLLSGLGLLRQGLSPDEMMKRMKK